MIHRERLFARAGLILAGDRLDLLVTDSNRRVEFWRGLHPHDLLERANCNLHGARITSYLYACMVLGRLPQLELERYTLEAPIWISELGFGSEVAADLARRFAEELYA